MLMLQVKIHSYSTQVSSLEENVAGLDQRGSDLEAGGRGSVNVTGRNIYLVQFYKAVVATFDMISTFSDLTERVEALESVTSQLSDATIAQDGRISATEDDISRLDTRVDDLESSSGNGTAGGLYYAWTCLNFYDSG